MPQCSVSTALGSMLPWALDRHVRMPAAHRAPGGLTPPVAPGGSSFARCHPRPRAVVRQGSRLVWLREDRCDAREPEGPVLAGPVRWQPEDCCAAGPPAPAREGEPGSARFDGAHPEGHTLSALRRDPEGYRRERRRRIPREHPPSPVRFTRRCSVSGYRGRSEERRDPRDTTVRQQRPQVRASHEVRSAPSPEGAAACDLGPLGHRSALAARKQEPNRRATRVAPRMERNIRIRSRAPEGVLERASPSTRHPKVGAAGLVAPASLQQAGGDRPRARQTSSPSRRPERQRLLASSRRPEGRRADASARGAAVTAHPTRQGGFRRRAPKYPRRK